MVETGGRAVKVLLLVSLMNGEPWRSRLVRGPRGSVGGNRCSCRWYDGGSFPRRRRRPRTCSAGVERRRSRRSRSLAGPLRPLPGRTPPLDPWNLLSTSSSWLLAHGQATSSPGRLAMLVVQCL